MPIATGRGRGMPLPVCLLMAVLAAPTLALPSDPEGGTLTNGLGRIKGTVTDSRRRPVVAARLVGWTSLQDRDLLVVTSSNAQGTYFYENLPAGTYQISALAQGARPERYTGVQVHPPFRNILDFRLKPGPKNGPAARAFLVSKAVPDAGREMISEARVTVSGMVRLAANRPVADAEMALVGGPPPGQWVGLTTPDGRFQMPGVPAATYDLQVTAPGAIPIEIPGVRIRPGRDLEVHVRLVAFPATLATHHQVILPPEAPLPPRRLLEIPPLPRRDPPPD